jgi:hypothetical protein
MRAKSTGPNPKKIARVNPRIHPSISGPIKLVLYYYLIKLCFFSKVLFF